jgi:glutamate synthase (NADPH/NADH) small chain
VLGINEPPVTIKGIEVAIIDRAFQEGWVKPNPPQHRTGKTVAVVGSGPAGLAAADQLNKAGHRVTVFERDDRIGGLLMYGVPNMKLDKGVVQRRVDLLADEGIEFRTGVAVGEADYPVDRLRADFDAVVLACGALKGRDLYVDGRDLGGVHFAMNYLKQSTKRLLDSPEGKPTPPDQLPPEAITATGKHVVVIGGGDTGADCIGTALREGCQSLLNITRRPREPEERDEEHPWPGPPGVYQLDYSHAEGQARFGRDPREYAVLPLGFLGDENGNVRAVQIERLQWEKDPKTGRMVRQNTGRIDELPAELVLLSIGFTGHDTPQLVTDLGLELDGELVRAGYGKFATNVEGVFAAGDMRRGASLIVWAIAEGRGVAKAVDTYLMGHSELPTPQMDEEPTGSGEFDLIGS